MHQKDREHVPLVKYGQVGPYSYHALALTIQLVTFQMLSAVQFPSVRSQRITDVSETFLRNQPKASVQYRSAMLAKS